MNYLDTIYRALVDYRKNTLDQNDCKTQRAAIKAADAENDVIEVTRKNCIVENDWIEAIEEGLVFIEKAIKEERQFIRSEGEVIPIEKVKRVSKDSVEHLARHSNYFTREQKEGEDMIPDQLYTVERLSDFAVYENRFLYMLLCYLRDFIGMRYEKIVEQTNTYNGKLSMCKDIIESKRKVKFELKLEEEKKNDDYLREHNTAQKEIDRILTIYRAVIVYLNTPLMNEVAKSPMIKPPIMRTNVLKMNRNFREALKLYEFVTAYDKDGYQILSETRTISPFNGVVAEEFAETVDLSLFLTYEHGLGIRDYFKENYEKEEERRREEARQKLAEQIRNVSRHLKNSGMTAEEYILLLERRIRDLEKEEQELILARKTIEKLEAEIEELKAELERAQNTVRALGEEIVRLNKKYADDMAAALNEYNARVLALTTEYEEKIDALITAHEEEITRLKEDHADEIARLTQEKEDEIASLMESHETEVATLKAEHEEKVNELVRLHTEELQAQEELRQAEAEAHAESMQKLREDFAAQTQKAREDHELQVQALNARYDSTSKDLNEKIEAGTKRIDELTKAYSDLQDRKSLIEARLNALRAEYGLTGEIDDFSTQEKMDDLERQYKAFKRLFKSEWSRTKRKIRREIFSKIFGEEKEREARARAEKASATKPVTPVANTESIQNTEHTDGVQTQENEENSSTNGTDNERG